MVSSVPLKMATDIGCADFSQSKLSSTGKFALSAAIANDIVDGVLDTGRKLLAAEAGWEAGQI
jgi:hypothetical protein